MTATPRLLLATAIGLLATGPFAGAPALAQPSRYVDGRYQPLDQRVPPGVTAGWVAATGGGLTPGYVQPVRIEVEGGGSVTFYSGPNAAPSRHGSPAQVAITVGFPYRLRVTDLPNLPGVELFPSVELVGHLHPPAGRVHDFPVRVPITLDEIELALDGRMITKVVYLEQPQLASPLPDDDEVLAFEVPPRVNVLHEADRRGRPIAIVRLGGRVADPSRPDPTFFGNPPPIRPSQHGVRPAGRLPAEQAPGTRSVRPVEPLDPDSLLNRFRPPGRPGGR